MAKALYGAGLVDMRNKINGWVFSKNRYGGYVRTKVTPVNPQTDYQAKARQRLSNLSSQWRGLTDSERKQWRDAAQDFPVIDIFGNPQQLAGNALYVQLNTNLLVAGQSTISSPPLPEAIPNLFIDGVSADTSGPTLDISVSENSDPTGFVVAVYSTGNVGPGIKFVKNRLRFLDIISISTGTIDAQSAFDSRFGNLIKGQRVSVQVRLISKTTGQAGIPAQGTTIITT